MTVTKQAFYQVLLFLLVLALPGGAYLLPFDFGFVNIYFFRLLLFVALVVLFINKDLTLFNGKFSKALLVVLLIWLCYAAISCFWVIDLKAAFKEIFYLATGISILVAITSLYTITKDSGRTIIIGWLFGFVLSCGIAFWEIIAGNHLRSSFTDMLLTLSHNHPVNFVPIVTFENPNHFAVYLVVSIPIFIVLFLKSYKSLAVCLFVLSLFLVYETGSRFCWLAILFQTVVIAAFLILKSTKSYVFPKKKLAFAFVLLSALYMSSIFFQNQIITPMVYHLKDLEALKKVNSDVYRYYQNVVDADAYYEKKNYDKAIEFYRKALKYLPNKNYPKVKVAELKSIMLEMENMDSLSVAAELQAALKNLEKNQGTINELREKARIAEYRYKRLQQKKKSDSEKQKKSVLAESKPKNNSKTKEQKKRPPVTEKKNNGNKPATAYQSTNSEKKQNKSLSETQQQLAEKKQTAPGTIERRINHILNGLQFLKESYGLGIGAGNYSAYLESGKGKHDVYTNRSPHNFTVEIIAQYGIIIFLVFSGWIVWVFWHFWKQNLLEISRDGCICVIFGLTALAGYLVVSNANSSFMPLPINWITLAFIAIAADSLSSKKEHKI